MSGGGERSGREEAEEGGREGGGREVMGCLGGRTLMKEVHHWERIFEDIYSMPLLVISLLAVHSDVKKLSHHILQHPNHPSCQLHHVPSYKGTNPKFDIIMSTFALLKHQYV